VEQHDADLVMTVDEGIGLHDDALTDRPFDREPAGVDLRDDTLDYGPTTSLGECDALVSRPCIAQLTTSPHGTGASAAAAPNRPRAKSGP